jgi:DNA-binding transcriptional LysR family regulator
MMKSPRLGRNSSLDGKVSTKPSISEFDRIDLGDLVRVLAVAEQGSIRRSALAMNTTQPTLTRRIRRLEAALGQEVLQRSVTGVSLTPFGRELVVQAKSIECALGRILRMAESGTHVESKVRVGAAPLPALLILPEAVRLAARARPEIAVRIFEGGHTDLLTDLRTGELDLVLAAPGPKARERDLTFKALFFVHLAVIASTAHPLATKRDLSLSDLNAARWALPSPEWNLRDRIEVEFQRQRVPLPPKAVQMPSPASLLQLVRSGDVVTVLPIEIVRDDVRAGSIVALHGSWRFSPYAYGTYVRTAEASSEAARRFTRTVERVVQDLRLSRTL